MSWINSLVFALQYNLRRYNIDDNKLKLLQISFFILDTRDFLINTFVKNIKIMKVFILYTNFNQKKNLDNFLQFCKSNRECYFE